MTALRTELESSRHLFQSPVYRGSEGDDWTQSYADALAQTSGPLSWDVATILSALGQSFAVGDRTLVQQIRRRPWLSDGTTLESIPRHDRLAATPREAATQLLERLREEALEVCAGRETIYVLLSGGLDSRIIAGVFAGLVREGRIARPEAVTWGTANSRDVVYGRAAAEHLGFGWHHVDLGPESLLRNVEAAATTLGGLVSPPHLHAMLWFANAPRDALVIASSWGDSIGRAEFSGRHVLELQRLGPNDAFGLLRREVLGEAAEGMQADLDALRERAPGAPEYVMCEHEQQGHYMRGMIGHAMSAIDHHCTLYQMFTDPRVYGLMWSIHPAMRVDDVYAELLEAVDPALARMPWARTNRALRGNTVGARQGLESAYHDYPGWTAGLYDRLRASVDPDWFGATRIFNKDAIAALGEAVRVGQDKLPGSGRHPYELWLWLAGFRRFADWVAEQGHDVTLRATWPPRYRESTVHAAAGAGKLRHRLQQNPTLTRWVRNMRRRALRAQALRRWPPRVEGSDVALQATTVDLEKDGKGVS